MVFISETSKIVKHETSKGKVKMIKVILDGLNILFVYRNELLIFLFVVYGLGKTAPMTNEIYGSRRQVLVLSAIPTGFTILSGVAFLFSFTTLISITDCKYLSFTAFFEITAKRTLKTNFSNTALLTNSL